MYNSRNYSVPCANKINVVGRKLGLSMFWINNLQGHIVLSVLVGLLLVVSPALARQQEGQQPAPDPQKRSTKEGKEDKDKPGGTVGKSKLEKETGTINDSILEVMTNYGTGEYINTIHQHIQR